VVSDPWDPHQNISGGVALLKIYLRRYRSYQEIAAAYRSGPGNLRAHGPSAHDLEYAARIHKHFWEYTHILEDALIPINIM